MITDLFLSVAKVERTLNLYSREVDAPEPPHLLPARWEYLAASTTDADELSTNLQNVLAITLGRVLRS
jgi:hypothetical protein